MFVFLMYTWTNIVEMFVSQGIVFMYVHVHVCTRKTQDIWARKVDDRSPENTTHLYNIYTMYVQRRCTNVMRMFCVHWEISSSSFSIVWSIRARPQTARARISNLVSGGLSPGLGSMYSVLRYFGTRVPILQYSSVLGTHTFKKYLYSYLYSSTFKNESTFNEYLRVLYEY